jgi:hypothetical protein
VQIRREAERERMNRGRGGRIEEAGDGGGGREDDGTRMRMAALLFRRDQGAAGLEAASPSLGILFLFPGGREWSPPSPSRIRPAALHRAQSRSPALPAGSSSNLGRRPPQSRPAAPPAAAPATASASAGEGPHAQRLQGAREPTVRVGCACRWRRFPLSFSLLLHLALF